MLVAALCAFAAGAVAGIFLAMRHFLRKRLPVWVALLHGVGGATGFTLLLLMVVREPLFQPARQAMYLFIATIALGCVNLLFHVRRKRHRTSLIVMHALTAVSGVGTLIYAIASHEPAEAAPGAVPPAAPKTAAPAEVAAPSVASAAPQASAAQAPTTPESPKKPAEIDPKLRQSLDKAIAFATKSSEILPQSRPSIAQIAELLKKHSEISLVEVQGHADERGEESDNLELTRGRAAAVVDALVAAGVERERLRSAGYAARCPADPECQGDSAPAGCHDPARWQDDRRVVIMPLRVGEASFQGELVCERAADLIPDEHRRFHVPSAAR